MQKVFVDTDVVIDFLTDRKPYSAQAAIIFSMSEYKTIQVCVSSLTFANCYYILRKYSSHSNVISKLNQLAEIVDITDVTKKAILNSLKSDFKDFEDAIQHETAKNDRNIKTLITSNIKDYQKSDLSIYTPELFLKSFQE
jgi:predicted nucleic acid-binding protein